MLKSEIKVATLYFIGYKSCMTKEEVEINLAEIGEDRHWLATMTGYSYDTLRNRLAPNASELTFAMQTKIIQAFEKHEQSNSIKQTEIKCYPSPEEHQAWDRAGIINNGEFNNFAISRINKLAESINSIEDLNITPMIAEDETPYETD